ncbi:hypothetical protein H0N96_02425 [Candidatus Micrarchaeota archaeon]|nr:hypothetical protein [Candidatus Micrarchaeota archaeon]
MTDEETKEERKLVALCIIAALVGITVLIAYARTSTPVQKSIDELSSENAGQLVLVKGRVSSVSFSQNGNAVLRICTNACITAFISKQLVEKMNATALDLNSLRKNTIVAVEGIVEENNNGVSLRILTPDAIDFLGYEQEG